MRQLNANLASIPHIRGVNNHMGSLLTQHLGHMDWLMQALERRGDLYFIDSRFGCAIAIAHPHPRTLEFIDQNISELERHEVTLVQVSVLISSQTQYEETTHVADTGTTRAGL